MGIYEFLGSVAEAWGRARIVDNKVKVGEKEYQKPSENGGWRKIVSDIMVDLRPGLKYILHPVLSQYNSMAREDAPEPAIDFSDKYILIDAAVESGIYSAGKIIGDEGKLLKFYNSIYKKLFPENLVPVLENFNFVDVNTAVLYTESHFAKYENPHETLLKDIRGIWSKNRGQEPEAVFDSFVKGNDYFSTFRRFGAFSSPFFVRLGTAFKNRGSSFNEQDDILLANLISFELISNGYWFENMEKRYLSSLGDQKERRRSIGVDASILDLGVENFPKRRATLKYMKVLEVMRFFGFMGKRRPEADFGDTNYSFMMFKPSAEAGPYEISPSGVRENKKSVGPLLKHLDRVAPQDIFPKFNYSIKELIRGWAGLKNDIY